MRPRRPQGGFGGSPPDNPSLARSSPRARPLTPLPPNRNRRYYYSEGWRPILPLAFVKAYPKLHALIQECWRVRRKERPNFDQIVSRLQGDIGDEIKRKEEPKIVLYSKEDDLIYRNRIGKEDEIEDSDEEEEGRKGTKRGDVVSKGEYEKALAAKDKVLDELKAKVKRVEAKEKAAKDEAMRELLEKMKKERERADEEKELIV
jgi:hypothetical protein